MFSQVYVCPRGGVYPITCWDTPPSRKTPAQADTPLSGQTPPPWEDPPGWHPPSRYTHPPGQVHPLGRYNPSGQTPPGRHPPRQVHPSWADTPSQGRHPPLCSACWDAVNKQAVRIPLECILVYHWSYLLSRGPQWSLCNRHCSRGWDRLGSM